MEIWKDILGYENCYQISNCGNVKSIERSVKSKHGNRKVPEKILSNKISKWGYSEISLCYENKSKTLRINRLVALHFIPNPENKPQVNHIDGNKWNNNVENLEWCTNSENQIHALKTGLKKTHSGENNKNSILSEEYVIKMRNEYKDGKRVVDLSKKYGIKYMTCWFIVKEINYKITPVNI